MQCFKIFYRTLFNLKINENSQIPSQYQLGKWLSVLFYPRYVDLTLVKSQIETLIFENRYPMTECGIFAVKSRFLAKRKLETTPN